MVVEPLQCITINLISRHPTLPRYESLLLNHPSRFTMSTGAGKKRVAVIGAGASGLTAMKCCLDEGLLPVCFERVDEVGGLWYYTERVREGQGCVMKSTIMNTCKEMMCFSDFPPAPEFPNFMNQQQVRARDIVQELCESRGGCPELSVLTSVDVKNY